MTDMPGRGPSIAHLPMVLAVWLSILTAAAPAEANRQKARELYRRGMAEYVLEHWSEAAQLFEAGFREQPEAAFLFNIGQAHKKAGRHAEAVRYYRKYLEYNQGAGDRAEVEQSIAEEERLMAASQASPPAAGHPEKPADAGPAPPGAAVESVPRAAVTPAPGTSAATRKPKQRWPMWVGIGAGALVVVGGAIALGVAYTTPNDAPIPDTTAGNISVGLK